MPTKTRSKADPRPATYASPPSRHSTPRTPSRCDSPRTSRSEETVEEEDEESVVTSTPNSTTSTPSSRTPNHCSFVRTNSKGLPLHIQKQLLIDIEGAGGLRACSVKRICDSRIDLFGEAASNLRKQVQNKINRWKELDLPAYYRLLATFSIIPQNSQFLAPSTTPEEHQRQQPARTLPTPARRQQLPPTPQPTTATEHRSQHHTTIMSRDNSFDLDGESLQMFLIVFLFFYIFVS